MINKIQKIIKKILKNSRIKYLKYPLQIDELNIVLIYKEKKFYIQFLFDDPKLNAMYELDIKNIEYQIQKILEELSEKILDNTRIIYAKLPNLKIKLTRRLL